MAHRLCRIVGTSGSLRELSQTQGCQPNLVVHRVLTKENPRHSDTGSSSSATSVTKLLLRGSGSARYLPSIWRTYCREATPSLALPTVLARRSPARFPGRTWIFHTDVDWHRCQVQARLRPRRLQQTSPSPACKSGHHCR